MNKEDLKQRINEIPEFEKRDIKIATKDENEWFDEPHYKAICEIGGVHPYTFVGKRYNIVQFKDVFGPMLDSIESDVDGYVIHYGGFGMLVIYPEDEQLQEGQSKFGLVAMNSVDCSSAVIVKFCVKKGERQITIPPKVAGLKKMHTGRVGNLVKDYMSMIGPVKQMWTHIIEEFPKFKLVHKMEEDSEEQELEFGTVAEQLGLGKRLASVVQKRFDRITAQGQRYTLWNAFVDSLDAVSEKNYKSDVHKQRKIDKLCEAVFKYSMVLNI